jgi:hypothetical protein
VSGHSNALCKAGGRQRRETIHETGSNKPAGRSQPAHQGSTLASLVRLASLWPGLSSHSLSSLITLSLSTHSSSPARACVSVSVLFAGSQQFCPLSFAQILFLTVGPLHCRPASFRPRHSSIAPASQACQPAEHPRPRATRQQSRGITLTARHRLCCAHFITTLAPPHTSLPRTTWHQPTWPKPLTPFDLAAPATVSLHQSPCANTNNANACANPTTATSDNTSPADDLFT